MKHAIAACALAAALLAAWHAAAGEARIAVAANFTATARAIGEAFTNRTGHQPIFSFGASGQLFAQIRQGAPFELLLSADEIHPERAIAEGLGVPGTAFTYAIGRLALHSAEPDRVTGPEALASDTFHRLAIANPQVAPYGAAALEVLRHLGLAERLMPKLVQGQSVTQAYQFIATGNAELGFVALAQLAGSEAGSTWVVPQELHAPIRQHAVLLRAGEASPAARAFLAFLRGDEAAAIIRGHGYALPAGGNRP